MLFDMSFCMFFNCFNHIFSIIFSHYLSPLFHLQLIQILLNLLLIFVFVVLLLFLCNQTLSYYSTPSFFWFLFTFITSFTFFGFNHSRFIFRSSYFLRHWIRFLFGFHFPIL